MAGAVPATAAIHCLRNVALGPLTTFGVAGTALRAWSLDSLERIDSLLGAVAACGSALPAFVLGGGSNVLVARDLAEPLILVRLTGRRVLDDDGSQVLLEIGAGEVWDRLVRWTLSRGWFGLENLSLIPGLVGAAPWQNIGAYGVEAAERIVAVNAVNMGSGEQREFSASDCAFGYRSSFFKTPAGRQWLITSVRLRLSRQPEPRIGYGEIQQELATLAARDAGQGRNAGVTPPTPLQVAAAVESIRRRKLPDPALVGNAGSFFKNPIVGLDEAHVLRDAAPTMPVYPVADDATRAKLSAGWLIEAAGWKGFRDGDAGVSSQHALVLVNHGSATGKQVLALAQRIQQSVFERFGVALEPEPVIVS